ncbi:uncharacterized protein LOC116341459 [Contarinia nasturtii]|uniref:uncharacterized protein LOC116341459 n=1 Tax=Contarinia nasturtii TaxID=265458 RepID=UPI0012D3C693|nr:uncharacterized protein LOC116341459 [Contarinia nasturtii]
MSHDQGIHPPSKFRWGQRQLDAMERIVMEQSYKKDKYLRDEQLSMLCNKLDLSKSFVKSWFAARRGKDVKRERQYRQSQIPVHLRTNSILERIPEPMVEVDECSRLMPFQLCSRTIPIDPKYPTKPNLNDKYRAHKQVNTTLPATPAVIDNCTNNSTANHQISVNNHKTPIQQRQTIKFFRPFEDPPTIERPLLNANASNRNILTAEDDDDIDVGAAGEEIMTDEEFYAEMEKYYRENMQYPDRAKKAWLEECARVYGK